MTQWREVLDEMIRERRSALVGYACLFVVDRREAEDLVHEAVVRTLSRTRSVTDVHAAEGYVRAAIRTTFLDGVRRQRTWRERLHLLADPTSAPAAEHAATAAVDVRSALAALSPRERACVALRYVDDLPVADVAAELGIGAGAVKRYLSDGTRKLREALGMPDDAPGEPGHERWIVTTARETEA
ncbi:sigma-70 family RNA polymerase sigma factor [uncultured Cellulomonas sp.]|uniref:sigma-70 family RNA polymerase sigma factor n=1 Tax=uncultured Cellulomonas sp. TaxID=189682 RepID=UPI0026296A38|nr:sigma-70 family RNA polymerase sigma factor [uncultured Cellulomonas sp.]